ncbi:hypothetical protein CBR_g50899 [Chara braunii]|uniref:CCHC-type domain-containing protein n=1 Tax=Chara braunii TaxID=69332 RepID=A0A388M7P9_CHABU|nr:hypothetical protein CBR_g50899 [Chara braunii]|eukprot:GBG90556.1 hypothetical protein CBR_g50899 [Chara braunii]
MREYGYVEIEVDCADMPWCSLCRTFFHKDSDKECPRSEIYKKAVAKEKGTGKEKEEIEEKGKGKEARKEKEGDPNFQEKVGEKEKETEKPPPQPSPSPTELEELKADGSSGSFGRSWVEHGILQLKDLWDYEISDWLPMEKVKRLLPRLRGVEQNYSKIKQAVPPHWVNALKDDRELNAGCWVEDPCNTGRLWKIIGPDLRSGMKVQIWGVRPASHNRSLVWKEDGMIGSTMGLQEVRVHEQFTKKGTACQLENRDTDSDVGNHGRKRSNREEGKTTVGGRMDRMNNGGFNGNGNGGSGNYGGGGYNGGSGQGVTCYNCGKMGHMARDCWAKRGRLASDPELDGMKEFYRDILRQKRDQEEKKRREEEHAKREEEDRRRCDELSRKAQELKVENLMARELKEGMRKQQEELRKQAEELKRKRGVGEGTPKRGRARRGGDVDQDFSDPPSEEESDLSKRIGELIRVLESRTPPRTDPEISPRRSPRDTPRRTKVTRRQTRFEQGESLAAAERRASRDRETKARDRYEDTGFLLKKRYDHTMMDFIFNLQRDLTSKRADRIKGLCRKAGIKYITRDQAIEELVRQNTDLAYEGLYDDEGNNEEEQDPVVDLGDDEVLTSPRPPRRTTPRTPHSDRLSRPLCTVSLWKYLAVLLRFRCALRGQGEGMEVLRLVGISAATACMLLALHGHIPWMEKLLRMLPLQGRIPDLGAKGVYEEENRESGQVLAAMRAEYDMRGLTAIGRWVPSGRLGQVYTRLKDQTEEIASNLTRKGRCDSLLVRCSDAKEMFTHLSHGAIRDATEWLFSHFEDRGYRQFKVAVRGRLTVLSKTRKKEEGYVTVTIQHIREMLGFQLAGSFASCQTLTIRQVTGIPMGRATSPALACITCAHAEFQFLTSLGKDRSLCHGIRVVDDITLFVGYTAGDVTTVTRAMEIVQTFVDNYTEGIVLIEKGEEENTLEFVGTCMMARVTPINFQIWPAPKNKQALHETRQLHFHSMQDFGSCSSKLVKVNTLPTMFRRQRMLASSTTAAIPAMCAVIREALLRGYPPEVFLQGLAGSERLATEPVFDAFHAMVRELWRKAGPGSTTGKYR